MNPRNKNCYIHIGAPKTGSTSIQKFLYDNRDLLAERGILYPDVNLRGFGHHDLAFLLYGEYPEWATTQEKSLKDLAEIFENTIAGHKGDLVISSENFYLYPSPEKLKEFLNACGVISAYDVKIITYIRRQDVAAESWYNQTIKAQGYTHTLDECLLEFEDLWDYQVQLESWAKTFGRSNLIVRSFEKSEFEKGNLLQDFLCVLTIDPSGLDMPTEYVNESLNSDILEFQRILNSLPVKPIAKRRFHRDLIKLSNGTTGSGMFNESPLIGAERRQSIIDKYHDSNEWVAKNYLGRERLFLLRDSPHPIQTSNQNLDGLNMKKLASIVGWLLLHNIHSRNNKDRDHE